MECKYVFIILFFSTILGGKNQAKEGSHFRDLSTWKKSKLGGFEKPYRVTNISWVDDISKSAFKFEMNIFLTQKKNCRFFFCIISRVATKSNLAYNMINGGAIVSAQYLKNEMCDLNETWYTYARW